MSTAVMPMPSVMFGSPRDWDKWFWSTYDQFLVYLRSACDPMGQEAWIKREMDRRQIVQ